MLAAGYANVEILQAIEATPERRVIDNINLEMSRQGVTQGNLAGICANADREIASGSPIGRLLR